MRILVLGAGVIGVTSAYRLAQDGHEVEVLEAGDAVGGGASAVNAGLLAVGDSTVWASPAAPTELARSLLRPSAGTIRIRPGAGPQLIPWGLRFLRECSRSRWRRNVAAAHALSLNSYREMGHLLARTPIEFHHRAAGMVFLSRRREGLDQILARKQPLLEAGEPLERLGSEALASLDPGFAATAPALAGAILVRRSGYGDCGAFTEALADLARARGVTLTTGQRVVGLTVSGGRVSRCETASGSFEADAYVLALGAASTRVARTAGIRLPVVPAAGISMTVPIVDPARIPRLGGVDEDLHVAFSPLGDALRISSTAEFQGQSTDFAATAYDPIHRFGEQLFPDALDWSGASRAAGLRPVTPNGLPLIGCSARPNLFLNTGHGPLGWTQACGSARLLADLIAERPPTLDPTPYQP